MYAKQTDTYQRQQFRIVGVAFGGELDRPDCMLKFPVRGSLQCLVLSSRASFSLLGSESEVVLEAERGSEWSFLGFVEMAGDGDKPRWAIDKAAWREAFAPFYKFASISERRDAPLPPWSEADVQEFIKSDPVYGPQLQLVRQGATIANVGAVVGGLATAGIALRYSKNLPGALGAFLGGAAMSWAVAEEGANFGLGLYKFNCMDANLKFLDWWERQQK